MMKRNHFTALLAVAVCLALTARSRAEDVPAANRRDTPLKLCRTEHFSIQHDASEAWAAELGGHLESLARQFYKEASLLGVENRRGPEGDRLAWLCLTSGRLQDPEAMIRFKADYDTRLHRVQLLWTQDETEPDSPPSNTSAFEPDGLIPPGCSRHILFTRLSHEAAHQLAFDSGLQKRGVMYPLWAAEGLAANFESPGDELHFLGPNPARQTRLKTIAEQQTLLPLSQLAVITGTRDLSPQERIDLYAQAWGLFRFLALEQRPALISYLRDLAALPCGQRTDRALLEEMRHSFGHLPDLEKEWLSWLADSLS